MPQAPDTTTASVSTRVQRNMFQWLTTSPVWTARHGAFAMGFSCSQPRQAGTMMAPAMGMAMVAVVKGPNRSSPGPATRTPKMEQKPMPDQTHVMMSEAKRGVVWIFSL